MSPEPNIETSGMGYIIAVHRCILFALSIFFVMPSSTIMAQTNAQDSLQVSTLISSAHAQLIKHNYTEATRIAKESLDRSTKLDFKWGIINSLLILGQSEKSSNNYAAGLNYYLQSLSEVEKQNDQVLLEWINLKTGELFQDWGVPEKALPYYTVALNLQSKRSNQNSVPLMERIAQSYLSINQHERALEMYFKLLDLVSAKKERVLMISTLEKIAFIYYQSGDLENSLKYNLQLVEVSKELNDHTRTASTLNVIGNQYKEQKKPDKALEYYQQSLALNRQYNTNNTNDNSIVANLINIGVIYQSRGDSRNAIKSYNEALEVKKKDGSPVEVAVMHNYLASLYLAQGNLSDAENHTQIAISLLSGTDNKRTLSTSYKRLSEIYEKQSNYEKALETYQSYSMLKDSLLYLEQLNQEKEKLKQFVIESAEKEAKLALIDQEMQALELRNEKEVAEREKKEIALLLKEKELQNLSLQKEQLEQARAVQHLQLQQGRIEKERQAQAILLLEQKRDLQNAEIQKQELLEKEREKEIAFKNTRLELQQSQLERVGIRQQFLIYTVTLFLALILLILFGYMIKQRDNKKLKMQYDEINRQKEQIELINHSLVELNEEKNDLIGIVAHDLKSPLNQISGMMEIIKLTSKDQPEELRVYNEKINESILRLKTMVSKILDVSAIESKTLNIKLENIDITRLLEEIIGRYQLAAEKKNISIGKEFQSSIPAIMSDVGYVSEVLENLMSNAVKYSPLEKKITVKLSHRSSYIRIEFIDEGQGISEKDMKNLFGKYHKLAARPTAGEDSTGLGLSIVKKYVQALNGKVWCESQEGKGSNFIVELPAA